MQNVVNRIFNQSAINFNLAHKHKSGVGAFLYKIAAYIFKHDDQQQSQRHKLKTKQAELLAQAFEKNLLHKELVEACSTPIFTYSDVKLQLIHNQSKDQYELVKYQRDLFGVLVRDRTLLAFKDKSDPEYVKLAQSVSGFINKQLTLFNTFKLAQVSQPQVLAPISKPAATFLFQGSGLAVTETANYNRLATHLLNNPRSYSALLDKNNTFNLNKPISVANKQQVYAQLLPKEQFDPQQFKLLFADEQVHTLKEVLDRCYRQPVGVIGKLYARAQQLELENVYSYAGSKDFRGRDYIAIAAQAVADLNRLNLEPGAVVNVAGYSRGTFVAIYLAKQFPHLKFNLLLCDPVKGPWRNEVLDNTDIPLNVENARLVYGGQDLLGPIADRSIISAANPGLNLTVRFYEEDDHGEIQMEFGQQDYTRFLHNTQFSRKLESELASDPDYYQVQGANLRLIANYFKRKA